jgi:hypothetical protein
VVLACSVFPLRSLPEPLLCWLLLQGPLVPVHHHYWLLPLIVWVPHCQAVEVATLVVVELALALLAFSVAIVRTHSTPR